MVAQPKSRQSLQLGLGLCSKTGKRPDNQDFVAHHHRANSGRPAFAAVADGVGGHKGGRVAAELTVRSFLDAMSAARETLGLQKSAFRALEAINGWIHAQGRVDPNLTHMSCTFSGLILEGRTCHVLHVGDSRIYRLSGEQFERLTKDHVLGYSDFGRVLTRAIGFEDNLRLDYSTLSLRQHDRLLICSDGVYDALHDERIRQVLAERANPDETARIIVETALDAGSMDNATALVVDIIDLPASGADELTQTIEALPILPLPKSGDVVDRFKIGEVLAVGRYSTVFHASDGDKPQRLIIKFPNPLVATEGSYRLAFVREAWIAERVRSIWVGETVPVPRGRQKQLYSVMPFYEGETLEQKIRRTPSMSLSDAIPIATKLARAVTSLHRIGVIHRDIKPENVILLAQGGLKLIDLGVARVPALEEFPQEDIPGTPSYMAPELFQAKSGPLRTGDEFSDQYALAVVVYRMLSGAYPYGEIEPFSHPKFTTPAPLSKLRPDLPGWVEAVLARALSPNPAHRYGDIIEFIHELETGAMRAKPTSARKLSLYEKNPLLVWQMFALFLGVSLVISLATRGH